MQTDDSRTTNLIPNAKTAAYFGVTTRSLARWRKNRLLAFPQPTIINGRIYDKQSDLEIWTRNRRIGSQGMAALSNEAYSESAASDRWLSAKGDNETVAPSQMGEAR